MRSLVTGGCGFIGSHVARHCRDLGHDVVVLDDLSGGFRDHLPDGVRLVEGSVTDHALVDRLVAEHRPETIYHLAAYAAEGLSHFIRRFNYEANLIGTANLLNAAVNVGTVGRFVFTSSIAVYGAGQVPMTEDTEPRPEDPYGVAKYAAELDLWAAHALWGLDVTVFRPHNVYGEHQNLGDRYRNVIGIFMNQLLRGEPMTIFGDGSQTRAFSHVDDVAPVIAGSVDVPAARNGTFNVGADDVTSVLELAHLVAEAFGVEPQVEHLDARREVVHAAASHDRARRVFGDRPTVPLREGVARMATWARTVGARETRPFTAVEVRRGLPASWLASLDPEPT
jgi:UDP-glucose 4-epimerase